MRFGVVKNRCVRWGRICLLVGMVALTGCTELPSDGDTGDGTAGFECPLPEEVDQLESQFR